MPSILPKSCAAPGCARVTHERFCSECARKQKRQYDKARPSAAKRGYDKRWQRLRLMVLRGEPLCRQCGAPATDVDHIVPRAQGGADELDNLQALCHSCHSRKTNREDKPKLPGKCKVAVTVVCGPPGSGKTSYVRERARWGDMIVDMDALYAAISGLPWYEKPDVLLPFVAEARDALIARLNRPSEIRHAWILMSGARRADRDALRQRLNAEVVVLEIGASECMRRISLDERRRDKTQRWHELIERWWREYERGDDERRVTG